jgi:hypothetical protein
LRHFGSLDHLAGPDRVAAALLAAGGGFGTADASRIFHVPPSRTSTLLVALALFLGLAFEEIYEALAALNVLL